MSTETEEDFARFEFVKEVETRLLRIYDDLPRWRKDVLMSNIQICLEFFGTVTHEWIKNERGVSYSHHGLVDKKMKNDEALIVIRGTVVPLLIEAKKNYDWRTYPESRPVNGVDDLLKYINDWFKTKPNVVTVKLESQETLKREVEKLKRQNRDLIHTQTEKDAEIEKLKGELQRLKAQVMNQKRQIEILDKMVNATRANKGVLLNRLIAVNGV